MATLNNNQCASILNSAIAQATGSAQIGVLNLQNIIDTGNDPNVIGTVDQFTKALVNVIVKNWFTDTSYRSQYKDVFFEDSEKFGAIIQSISVDVPDVQPSHVWTDVTSGTTTAGVYTLYKAVVHNQLYGKSISWELPICISEDQLATAFHGVSEMREFIAYILMCVDNALVVHLENMNSANRNNFIAEKISYASGASATGVHVIDLVAEYAIEKGESSMTVEQFLNNADALRFASAKINLIRKYFGRMSTVFNTAGRKRFTPNERIVLQILSDFEQKFESVAQSETYHNELTALPNYESVPYWQGNGGDFSFDNVSSISVKTGSAGDTIEQSGIVAFLCDKWAIMHTIKSKRVAVKVFEPEAMYQTYYQFCDQYANDLTMNAVVFVLNDYTA